MTDPLDWHDEIARTLPEDIRGDFLPDPVLGSSVIVGKPFDHQVVFTGGQMLIDGVPVAETIWNKWG